MKKATTDTADVCSYLPSHAEFMCSACLELLGMRELSRGEKDPAVDLAVALNAREPPDSLLALYRRIKSPGVGIVSALARHFLARKDTALAVELAKDIDPEALLPRDRVIYAELLTAQEDFDGALLHIARAYSEDEELKDAHARIAWNIFWPRKEFDRVIEWMEKDDCGR